MDYKKYAQLTCTLLVTTFINSPLLHSNQYDYTVIKELPSDNFSLDSQTGQYTLPNDAAASTQNQKVGEISYVPPLYSNAPQSVDPQGYTVVMELPADQFLFDKNTGKYTAVQKPFAEPSVPSQPSNAPYANFNPRYYNCQAEAPCQPICQPTCASPQECTNCVMPATFRVGLEFAAGRYIALDQSYGGVTLLAVPEWTIGGIHPLIDIRGFKLENRNWAGSAGLGFRKYNAEAHKVFGVNFFYDYRNQKSFSYHQWGFGLEVLSGCWEAHLNGYMPVGKTDNEISQFCQQFEDGLFAVFRQNEFALRGLEFSAGGRWSFCNDFSLYVAPGFYMYNNNDIGNVQGIQGIVEFDWNEWLSFRVNASYDSKFRGRVQGIIELSIPFNFGCNPCACTCCDNILGRPIWRNDMIFTKRCTSVERNFDDCGIRNCSIFAK